ncbi:hypothetical protein [Nocardioides aquiterrae]|uniref:Uncharacterized protein n=1 Tax=Nocardioides aquiterrae TaxID=203799 RepID=A0ABP4EZ65_9ACTN
MSDGEQQPVRTARKVTLIAIGGILVVLVIMLAIVLWLGDPTNDIGENQPTPSPGSSGY